MRIEIKLLSRTVTDYGAVLFDFDDKIMREYCSEIDAIGDAMIDPSRVQNVLRDLLISIGSADVSDFPITAIYNDADADGNIVKVTA